MNDTDKKEIIKRLEERNAKLPCPRCGNQKFILLDGFINEAIQQDIKKITLGGIMLPAIGTVCDNCGFISYHALGVLGLLNKSEN